MLIKANWAHTQKHAPNWKRIRIRITHPEEKAPLDKISRLTCTGDNGGGGGAAINGHNCSNWTEQQQTQWQWQWERRSTSTSTISSSSTPPCNRMAQFTLWVYVHITIWLSVGLHTDFLLMRTPEPRQWAAFVYLLTALRRYYARELNVSPPFGLTNTWGSWNIIIPLRALQLQQTQCAAQ